MNFMNDITIAKRIACNDGLGTVWVGSNTTNTTLTGINNTFIGQGAGAAATSGYENVCIGDLAGTALTDAASNVFIGENAGQGVTSSSRNTFVGSYAGQNHSGTVGWSNTYIGRAAGNHDVNGQYNTMLGHAAGYYVVGDSAVSNGSFNTYLGDAAGQGVVGGTNTGSYNVCVGESAGTTVTAANANQSGNNNTYIGTNSGPYSSTQRNNNVAIGYGALCNGSDCIAIGNGTVANASNVCVISSGGNAVPLGLGVNAPTMAIDISQDTFYQLRARKVTANTSCLGIFLDGLSGANNSYLMWGVDTDGSTVGYTTGGAFVSTAKNGTGTIRNLILHTYGASDIHFATSNTLRGKVTGLGSFVLGQTAISTSATDGFTYLPTCAGTPTGVPTTQSGAKACVYDTTANKLWIYNGSWRSVTLA